MSETCQKSNQTLPCDLNTREARFLKCVNISDLMSGMMQDKLVD